MLMDEETKGFIAGFATSVAAGLVTLYIFQEYIATKAATKAIEEYNKRIGMMSINLNHRTGSDNNQPSTLKETVIEEEDLLPPDHYLVNYHVSH